jgi:Leucine-rich repeat (LRR) protein
MGEKIPQWAQQRIDEVREKGLTDLSLSGWFESSKLISVPDIIAQLSNLRSLDLSGNQLITVPDYIAQLPNLQLLKLHIPLTLKFVRFQSPEKGTNFSPISITTC